MFKKLISILLSFTFITTQPVFAQGVAQLNMAQYLSSMPAVAADRFRPLHMRYLSYDIEKDSFQLLLDKGDNKDINVGNGPDRSFQEKTKVLMEYFQIGLSLPNDKFWVNLRPDAQDQIIDPELEKTDLGKVMLEADLQLKKDTASFTSPQTPEGRLYWDKLYKKAGELFGTENITIPTITRPWIVPGEIILRQGEDSAYIFKANMKVMLEQDHLKGSQVYDFKDPRMKELNEYSSQLIRELIIPKLTKEVNISKRYAALRQVFFSLVMARWFKDTFSGKPGQYAQLIDSHNLNNLTSKEAWSKSYYFNEYKKSFEKGEYNFKEDIYTPSGQVIRSYVSGGVVTPMENPVKNTITNTITGRMLPVLLAVGIGFSSFFLGNGGTGAMKEVDAEEYSVMARQDNTLTTAKYFRARKETHDNIRAFTRDLEEKFPHSRQIIRKIQEYIMNLSKEVFSLSPAELKKMADILLVTRKKYHTDYPIIGLDESLKEIFEPIDNLVGNNNPNDREKIRLAIRQATLDLGASIERSLKGKTGSSPLMPEKEPIKNFEGREQLFSRQDTDKIEPQRVKFKKNEFGQTLEEFNFGNRTFKVEKIVSYDKERWVIGGKLGYPYYWLRRGTYSLKDENGFRYSAKIEDAGDVTGEDRRIFLLELKLTEENLSSLSLTPEKQSSPSLRDAGGIDFRTMNYLVQPMGSFKDLRFGLPTLTNSALERIDLDKELEVLRNMVKAGMVPSGARVKEYLAAVFQKGKMEKKQDDLLVCLAEIYRLAEEENLETSPELRESLVIVDTGKFVLLPSNQKVGLN